MPTYVMLTDVQPCVTFGVATPDSAIQFFRSAAPVPWTEGPSELITHGLGLQQQIRASE